MKYTGIFLIYSSPDLLYTVADLGGFQRFHLKPTWASTILEIH